MRDDSAEGSGQTDDHLFCARAGAFQPLIQVALEAGIAIRHTNAQVGLLCGSVAAERTKEVAALLSKKATFLCAINREVIYDVH